MKNIKDPIYGYIEIEDDYFSQIIDTPVFQRLRNIRQTGYQSLYPCALHNRFVHSLGVYYLGKKGIEYLQKNTACLFENQNWNLLKNTFLLACLLHDVGHSPFSHTGEYYYEKSINFVEELSCLIINEDFSKEIKNEHGKPHEAMSAIVGLSLCEKIDNFDPELFVRAIIGLSYASQDKALNNALIGLLNGDIIDVDKLDYIIRDSYVTGYSNVSIDFDRLLAGYTITSYKGNYVTAYKRGALSVIENVIFAKDLEQRWIQNNPIILYDCKITDLCIRRYNSYMQRTYNIPSVFLPKALLINSIDGVPLSLLCDDDIVVYIKNNESSFIAQQFFNRKIRLKPVWKTEADFDSIVSGQIGDKVKDRLVADLEAVVDSLDDSLYINAESKEKANQELEVAKEKKVDKYIINSYEKKLNIIDLFQKYTIDNGRTLDFQFAILFAEKFTTNYRKLEVEKLYISLSDSRVEPLNKISSLQAADGQSDIKSKLFYIYTTENNLEKFSNLGEDLIEFMRRNYH